MISRVYWIRTVDFTRTIVGLFYLRAPRRDETFQTAVRVVRKIIVQVVPQCSFNIVHIRGCDSLDLFQFDNPEIRNTITIERASCFLGFHGA